MVSKRLIFLALATTMIFALSGCGIFGGGGNANAKATPTLPFPTPIVIGTTAPGGDTNAPTAVPAPGGNGVGISGQVFNDSNANGALDDGEPVIAGVTVQLAMGACPGQPTAQTISTADTPAYKFDSLAPGDYCVLIDGSSAANTAVLGPGQWTVPQPAQGVITADVNLKKKAKGDVNFGWTFASLGQATPEAGQPTAVAAQPTAEAVQPTAQAVQPTPIAMLPTPTAFVPPTPAPQACVFRAAYLADVTVPDGTLVLPGAQFIKTWRLQNTGTCSWGPGSGLSNLGFVSGNPFGAPNVVPIPNSVPVGATTDLSIQMFAPAQGGVFTSNWKLRTDDGGLIGVGPYNAALYAQIRVQAAPPPTSVVPPTSVPPPPPPGQAIKFAAGATEAEAQGQLPANGIATYTLAASAGQNMSLSLSSNSNTARIAVLSPAGAPLPPQRSNPEGTYWQGNLPANGTYVLQVLAGNGAPTANFSLNVTIPVRITFAPGAISAQVQGTTSQGRIVTYLLKANGGQTMTAALNAPPNSAGITIYGLDDGQPLIRSQSGATSFNGQLPATQDYVIQVVPFGNTQVNFGLSITVQ